MASKEEIRNRAIKDRKIIIKGAREHNLQNIDVIIPRDNLVVLENHHWHLIQSMLKDKEDMLNLYQHMQDNF